MNILKNTQAKRKITLFINSETAESVKKVNTAFNTITKIKYCLIKLRGIDFIQVLNCG